MSDFDYSRLLNDNKMFDLYCITSLFTYQTNVVLKTIKKIKEFNQDIPIILGGIAASLIPEYFPKDIFIFRGTSKILDNYVPDYTIDYDLKNPWDKFSYTFTTRGCPNRCAYCAVWRIEPDVCVNENWKSHIVDDKLFAMIYDNNLSAQSEEHFKNVILYLAEKKKKAMFDNGFDCKYITKEKAELLAKLKYVRTGCRLAFDRLEDDGTFQKAIELLIASGIPKSSIMAYVLFNFKDKPKEAAYRLSECARLGITPYPQQYTPLNQKDDDPVHIGKYWTLNLVRNFRYYGLMGMYYRNYSFETWLKSEELKCLNGKETKKFGKEDWDILNG